MLRTIIFFAVIAACLFLTCLPWRMGSCPSRWPIIWFGCGTVLSWFVYLALIILVVYFIVKSAGAKRGPETPLDILKKRYAKGELTKDEFERMKDDLRD